MKNLLAALSFIYLTFSCDLSEIKPEIGENDDRLIKTIEPNDSLIKKLGQLIPEKSRSNLLNEIDLTKAIQSKDTLHGLTHYSFSYLAQENQNMLKNVVLTENKQNETDGVIIEYHYSDDWLYNEFEGDFSLFSGEVISTNLSGDILAHINVTNGSVETSSNGRVEGTTALLVTQCDYVTVQTPEYESGNISCYSYIQYEYISPNSYSTNTVYINNSSSGYGGGSGTLSPTGPGVEGLNALEMKKLIHKWKTENITLSPSFQNDPCAMGVYNALTENDDAWKMIAGFTGESPKGNIEFEIAHLPTSEEGKILGATTQKLSDGGIRITMNSSLFESYPFLSIARVMLHEFVHAELFYKKNTNDSDFAELFNEYADAQYGSLHHNIMVNNYVKLMGSILSKLDNAQFDNIEYYEAIAYIGLEETDYYKNEISGKTKESVILAQQTQVFTFREPCK